MKNNVILENELFSAEVISGVCVMHIKGNPLYRMTDLNAKEILFQYLDDVAEMDACNILLIDASTCEKEHEQYAALFRKGLRLGKGRYHHIMNGRMLPSTEYIGVARFCYAIDQLVLKIVRYPKLVIHVDSGEILSPLMNLSLACDYRIISKGSIYKNPYLELGLVPKGGSAFFLTRLLGFQKASQVLLSIEGIPASRAQQVGIADEVVPKANLFERALEVAKSYAGLPGSSLSGIKKILNATSDELERCLDIENELIFQITKTDRFYEKMTESMGICQ